MLLEECKYVAKEKNITLYIIDNIKIYSDSDRENSDKGNSDEENFKSTNVAHILKPIFEPYKKYFWLYFLRIHING